MQHMILSMKPSGRGDRGDHLHGLAAARAGGAIIQQDALGEVRPVAALTLVPPCSSRRYRVVREIRTCSRRKYGRREGELAIGHAKTWYTVDSPRGRMEPRDPPRTRKLGTT
jgi:hypothetical protein